MDQDEYYAEVLQIANRIHMQIAKAVIERDPGAITALAKELRDELDSLNYRSGEGTYLECGACFAAYPAFYEKRRCVLCNYTIFSQDKTRSNL